MQAASKHPQQQFPRTADRRGFSLIEVVVAVGIFAIAIVSVIGLLGPINKTVSDVRDFDNASRVVAAVQGELQREAQRIGLETFATTYLDQSPIYASSDGQKVAAGGATVWDSDGEKFFAITLTRNTDLSDPDDDDKSGYLAFTIKLSWPAYTPDEQPTASSQQSVMVVPAAITR